jgi:hypothetical protein
MFDILNLIQVASLHLEEFVDRDAGTDGSNDDSKRKQGAEQLRATCILL